MILFSCLLTYYDTILLLLICCFFSFYNVVEHKILVVNTLLQTVSVKLNEFGVKKNIVKIKNFKMKYKSSALLVWNWTPRFFHKIVLVLFLKFYSFNSRLVLFRFGSG